MAQLDQTIPGGAYFVEGRWVDADGDPLDKDEIGEAKALAQARADAAESEAQPSTNVAELPDENQDMTPVTPAALPKKKAKRKNRR